MKLSAVQGSAIVAFLLGVFLFSRTTLVNQSFQENVRKSLTSSEGYDQKFIDLVNHLEDVLATRASFAYPGGKDPMTGRQREVAVAAPTPERGPKKVVKVASKETGPNAPKGPEVRPEPQDNFKLTALIADDFGRYTAIVMDGERSMSVDVGDQVSGKVVSKITNREITLDVGASLVTYSLNGTRSVTPK